MISGHLGWVRCVAVDPSNDWFVTGSGDRTIKVTGHHFVCYIYIGNVFIMPQWAEPQRHMVVVMFVCVCV